MNPSLAPSLDGFLKVHGLTIASFDGKSTEAALRMCGLDDRALANLGDAHRDRCLVVRGALLDRLTRDPNPYPEEDTGDEPNEGDDSPTRKGKKKVKPAADDDEEAAEEPRDTTPDRHEPRAMAEAIMLAG